MKKKTLFPVLLLSVSIVMTVVCFWVWPRHLAVIHILAGCLSGAALLYVVGKMRDEI